MPKPYEKQNVYDYLRKEGNSVFVTSALDRLQGVCHISDAALQRIMDMATHARNGDTWTQKGMHNYLQYTWLAQLASKNISHIEVKDPKDPKNVFTRTVEGKTESYTFRKMMTDAGLSDNVCVFNTGLVNDGLQPIYLYMVQDLSLKVPYVVREGQVVIRTSPLALRLYEILCDPNAKHGITFLGPKQLPPAASYFKGGEQWMIFNTEKEVKANEQHIVKERANRFVTAGVLDRDELIHVLVDVPRPDCAVNVYDCTEETKTLVLYGVSKDSGELEVTASINKHSTTAVDRVELVRGIPDKSGQARCVAFRALQ